MLILSSRRARCGRAAVLAVLLVSGLAVAACSSPTPRFPGSAPDGTTEDGGAPVDTGRMTDPPPGPDPSMIQFTIEPPATIDPDAPYPPPPPTDAAYPAPGEETDEAPDDAEEATPTAESDG